MLLKARGNAARSCGPTFVTVTQCFRLIVVAAIVSLISPSPGQAGAMAEAIKAFGLVGKWSSDCGNSDSFLEFRIIGDETAIETRHSSFSLRYYLVFEESNLWSIDYDIFDVRRISDDTLVDRR